VTGNVSHFHQTHTNLNGFEDRLFLELSLEYLHPVQSASIQNVDTAPTVDQDSEDTTATNMHDDDHGTPHTFQMMP